MNDQKIERAMSAALVGNKFSRTAFQIKNKSVVTAQYLQWIQTFLTLKLSQ